MKIKNNLWVLFVLAVLHGCGADSGILDDDSDTHDLSPRAPITLGANVPSPPATAKVIRSVDGELVDVQGLSITLRGVNLLYSEQPAEQVDGVAAIKSVGSNVVRIRVTKNTTDDELRAVMEQAVEQNVIALLSFWGPEGEIECTRDGTHLLEAVESYWLGEWVSVLADSRYQSHLMINIASKWGPTGIYSATASKSYADFIEHYKYIIQQFRIVGFRVPLVVDAPGCGTDHLAFLGGRAQELLESDSESNVVLSAHAYGVKWDTKQELQSNISDLQRLSLPFLISDFGGDSDDDTALDHNQFMLQAAGDYAALLNLPWDSDSNKVSYGYPLSNATNAMEKNLRMDVYLPQVYVDDGQLSMQMYLRDASGNIGLFDKDYAGSKIRNHWNRLTSTAFTLADFEQTIGDFTGENITHVGLVIDADGKPADVIGEIRIDNVVFGGELEPIYEARFDTDSSGWDRRWGAPVALSRGVYQEAGTLNVLPDWGSPATEGGAPETMVALTFEQANTLQPALDLSEGFVLSFDVFVPEEFADETDLTLQPFFTDNTENNLFAGLAWLPRFTGGDNPIEQIKLGEWQTFTIQIPDFGEFLLNDGYTPNDSFDLNAGIKRIGLQILNVNTAKLEAIQVDNFVVDRLDTLNVGGVEAYRVEFTAGTAGWGRGFGEGADDAAPVTQQDNALAVLPSWGDGGENYIGVQHNLSFAAASAIDLGYPIAIRYRVFIPEEYSVESSLAVQTYMNSAAGADPDSGWNDWSGFAALNYAVASSFTLGGWTEVELNVSEYTQPPLNYVDGFNSQFPIKALGIQISNVNSAKTQPILIDDVSVEVFYPTGEAVLEIGFDTQEAFDALVIDDLAGLSDPNWTSVAADGVLRRGFGVRPFNWIAWSWYGMESEFSDWGLSDYVGFIVEGDPESGVSLTPLGDEIVNGANGIRETSVEVNFVE